MNTEQITARIAALKIELEQLIIEANRQIGMKQGAIAELERLLITEVSEVSELETK